MVNHIHLSHLSGLRLTGEDAVAFAHSQFCSDIRTQAGNVWQLTAWSDAKGRCLSTILLQTHQDGVELIFPRTLDELLGRLRLFTIGRKVSLSTPMAVFGSRESSPPNQQAGRIAMTPERYLWLEPTDAPGQQKGNAAAAGNDPMADWILEDINAGIPWLTPATSGHFLPQYLGLEALGRIDYRKGCYPGQEIIARLHYLGKPKYHLARFHTTPDPDNPLNWPTGSRLTVLDDLYQGQTLDVLTCQAHADGQAGLVVAPITIALPSRLAIEDEAGLSAQLELVALEPLC